MAEQDLPLTRALPLHRVEVAARAILRCRAADIPALERELNIALPEQACRATVTDSRAALWLGPDEWLLLDFASAQTRFPDVIEPACSIVDVSHRQIAYALHGPMAEEMLSTGCALDVSETAFPVGMCTRTLFNKAEIMLWRTGAHRFHIEIWRSFSHYLENVLTDAAWEIG